jgi:hypothetical protein
MSWCGWVYLTTDRNAVGVIFLVVNAGGTQFQTVRVGSDGTTLEIATQTAATGGGTNLATGTWYHIGYTRSGATHQLYTNGVAGISRSENNALTAANLLMMSNTANFVDGRIAGVKVWSGVALTAAEMANEVYTLRPARTANLHAWWPMLPGATERLIDYSGNARSLTANGTLTDEDPPPVAWGDWTRYVIGQPGGTGVTVTPSALSLTIALRAPTVTAGGDVTVQPSRLAATLALGTALVVLQTTDLAEDASVFEDLTFTTVVAPSVLTPVLTLRAPTVSGGATVSPSSLNAALALPTATVSTATNVTVTPASLNAALALTTATVTAAQNVTVTPSSLNAALALASATVQTGGNITVSPSSLNAALGLTTATVSAGVTVSPGRVPMAVALATATTTVAEEVAVLNAALTLRAPTVSTGATIAPAALTAVMALVAPTVSAGGSITVSPGRVALTVALPSPSVAIHATVTPGVFGAVFDILAASVSTTRFVEATPSAIVAAITLLTPSVATPPNELPGTVGLGITALGGVGIGVTP